MALFTNDPEDDIRIVVDAIKFLHKYGATIRDLEAISGASYRPSSRLGEALRVAVERGLVEVRGVRYHVIEG